MFVAAPRVQLTQSEDTADLGRVVASVGAAVDATHDEWEAETGDAQVSEQDFAAAWTQTVVAETAVAEGDDLVEHQATDHFEYHETRVDGAAEDVPAWAQHDVVDEGAEEPAPAALEGMVEPDPVWADAAAASAIAGLDDQIDAEDDQSVPDEDDYLDQGAKFDEDVLRELVRDILREELAGKMGERITRNIRKLVRAEIARAMLTQDFE